MSNLEIIETLEKLSVVELNNLVKELEERWGVQAVSFAPAAASGVLGGGQAAEAVEEKTSFDLVLTEVGDAKLAVIKVVREITGIGIKEAKELVDAIPKAIKTGLAKADAEELKKKLEAAGAKAELK